eukprot:Hpha_TRINITY_DN15833_c2_g6::TRINITY_DN15833_c2_g6_i1::g.187334::m.187334
MPHSSKAGTGDQVGNLRSLKKPPAYTSSRTLTPFPLPPPVPLSLYLCVRRTSGEGGGGGDTRISHLPVPGKKCDFPSLPPLFHIILSLSKRGFIPPKKNVVMGLATSGAPP